jgi:hypothetical protein
MDSLNLIMYSSILSYVTCAVWVKMYLILSTDGEAEATFNSIVWSECANAISFYPGALDYHLSRLAIAICEEYDHEIHLLEVWCH